MAVFSAVAAAAAGYSVTGAGFAAGYRNGLIAAASVAAGLAIVALLALPPVRSARGGREAVR